MGYPPAPAIWRHGDPGAAAPAPAEPPAYEPRPGDVAVYEHESAYPTPHKAFQIVLVVEVTPEGRARGFPIGYADQAAEFPPGALGPLVE